MSRDPRTISGGLVKFPIPMRGNEYAYVAHLGQGVPIGGFPIPMRGNESHVRLEARNRNDVVSNPHEG